MADQEAGWRNDPYGRFQQRYFDGKRWTEHVATGGEQQVDPLGSSTAIPIAIPSTAFQSSGRGQGIASFIAREPNSQERQLPRGNIAVAGLGGLVLAAALYNAILGDNGTKTRVVITSLLVLALGLAIRLFVKRQAELRSAAVGLGFVGILGFMIGAFDDVGEAGPLFLIAALFLAAWALPGFNGRPLMLGSGALFFVLALAALFSPGNECRDDAFGDICEAGEESFFGVPDSFRGLFDNQRFVYLLAGLALLAFVGWLDKKGLRGTATPLLVTGLISSFLGTLKSTTEIGKEADALIVLLVGLIVCFVGSAGTRRVTTWLGAYQVAAGTGAFIAAVFEPTSRTEVTTTLVLTAAALIGVPAAARTIRSRQTTSTPPPPPSVE